MFRQRREIAALNRKLRDAAPRETAVAGAAAKAK
jgi:hypothetical protein